MVAVGRRWAAVLAAFVLTVAGCGETPGASAGSTGAEQDWNELSSSMAGEAVTTIAAQTSDPAQEGGSTTGSTGTTAPADPITGASADDTDSGSAEPDVPLPQPEADPGCEVGSTAPSQVVMIGDSYFDATTVPTHLWSRAQDAGSLQPGQTYRRYYRGGTQLTTAEIPGQFQAAVIEDPDIVAVLMTGGGNDVIGGVGRVCMQTPAPAPACVDALEQIVSTADALLATMATAGVQDVVYFFYPHLPATFSLSNVNATFDALIPSLTQTCELRTDLDCHFVDTRAAFEGHPEYFSADSLHPSPAGSEVIADLIWQAMQTHCVAP